MRGLVCHKSKPCSGFVVFILSLQSLSFKFVSVPLSEMVGKVLRRRLDSFTMASPQVATDTASRPHPTVIQAGYLVKQDTSTQKHSCRWAVLTSDGLLTYFKYGPKASKGRVIALSNYTTCEEVVYYDPSLHIFTLYNNDSNSYEKRTFTFYASTREEAATWVESIKPFLGAPRPK